MLLCVYFLSIWPDYMLFESKLFLFFFFKRCALVER